MLGVSADDVIILNVTSIARRRLGGRQLGASTSSTALINALYVVSVSSHYTQSELQSQLLTATTNGVFNTQLTTFAQRYQAVGFVNALSAGLAFLSKSPTASPSTVAHGSSSSGSYISELEYIVIPTVVGFIVLSGVVILAVLYQNKYFAGGFDNVLPCFSRPKLRSPPLAARSAVYSPSSPTRNSSISRDEYRTSLDRTPSPEQFRPTVDWVNHWKARAERRKEVAAATTSATAQITELTVNIDDEMSDVAIYPRLTTQVEFVNPTLSSERRVKMNRRS